MMNVRRSSEVEIVTFSYRAWILPSWMDVHCCRVLTMVFKLDWMLRAVGVVEVIEDDVAWRCLTASL